MDGEIMPEDTMHFEIVPNKVFVKIYNRGFKKSSQYYLIRSNEIDKNEVEKNHKEVLEDAKKNLLSGANYLCILHQKHTSEIIYVDNPWKIGNEPLVDGLYSNRNDLMLGIVTADCVPIMIASECGTYIGGIHAGWKGALSGIVENYASILKGKTSKKLLAVVGPAIAQKSYEVDIDYYNNFILKSDSYKKYFIRKNEKKYLFDLPGFVIGRLESSGIEVVKHFNDDTFEMPEKYPSNRYYFVNKLGKYKGEILSTIFKI